MATKPKSRKPAMEAQAKAEAAENTNVVINRRYNYDVVGPGGDKTEVDVLGISKADMWMGAYETEDDGASGGGGGGE